MLFFLVYGMNGTWGGNNRFDNAIGYENLATSNEVQRGFDNQNQLANEREILAAVTINAACAVGRGDTLGTVEPGKRADLVLWDAKDLDYLVYRMGSNLAKIVIRKGIIVKL